MPTTASGYTSFMLDVPAKNVELLELQSNGMDEQQEKWRAFTSEASTSLAFNETRAYAPPSAAQRMPPRGAIPPATARELEYRYRTYPLMWGASADGYVDDLEDAKNAGGVAAEIAEKTWNVIPTAFSVMRNQMIAALINYSFPSSTIPAALSQFLNVLGADGLTGFSTAHTYNSSANTWSNLPSADGTPSVALLNTWDVLFKGIRQPTNYPNMIRNKKVVCDPFSTPTWKEVLLTDFMVNSANNNVNRAKFLVQGTDLVEWEWLANNFSFAKADMGKEFDIQHIVRRGVTIEQDYEKSTRRRILYATSRENFMWPAYNFSIIPSLAG